MVLGSLWNSGIWLHALVVYKHPCNDSLGNNSYFLYGCHMLCYVYYVCCVWTCGLFVCVQCVYVCCHMHTDKHNQHWLRVSDLCLGTPVFLLGKHDDLDGRKRQTSCIHVHVLWDFSVHNAHNHITSTIYKCSCFLSALNSWWRRWQDNILINLEAIC